MKAKTSKQLVNIKWTSNLGTLNYQERAKRALKHALAQKEFWEYEVEFWREKTGEKVYNMFMGKE